MGITHQAKTKRESMNTIDMFLNAIIDYFGEDDMKYIFDNLDAFIIARRFLKDKKGINKYETEVILRAVSEINRRL